MKNSGIEWIEGLPDTWQEIPNRYLFIDHSKKVGEQWKDYQLLSLTTSGVKEKDVNVSGGKVPDSYENYQTVEKGDMVFCLFDLDCSAVFSGLSNYNGMITSAYDVFMPNHKYLDDLYADYWFQYVFSNRYYKMYSKNIRYTITGEMFKSVLTPIPSLEEQRKIGAYLLEKDKQITNLIANQEKQIEKLKEYKQSVITEAVTKGLDKSAPMKDSNLSWIIGKVPAHWAVVNPKALFSLRRERAKEGERQLTASQQYGVIYQDDYMRLTGSRIVVVMKDFDILKHVEKGDFVISMRSFQGGLEYSENDGSISSAYVMLKPNRKYVVDHFYKWLFKSSLYINALQSTSDLIRDGQAMRYSNFTQLWLYQIPLKEQEQIASYLDKKCADIDKLIAIKQEKIEKLNEYKKSLIYEYVTGKKEVV